MKFLRKKIELKVDSAAGGVVRKYERRRIQLNSSLSAPPYMTSKAISSADKVAMSSTADKVLMIIGVLASAMTGIAVIIRAHLVGIAFEVLSAYLVHENVVSEDLTNGNSTSQSSPEAYQSEAMQRIATVGIGYAVLSLVNFLSAFIQITTWEYVCQNQVNRIRSKFFDMALKLEVSWHDQMEKTDDLITRLTDDIEKMRHDLGSKVTLAMSSIATLVSAVIYVTVSNWILGIIVIIGSLIIFVLVVASGKINGILASKEQENNRETGYIANEVLTSLKIVKSFGRENTEIEHFERTVVAGKKIARKKHFVSSIQFALIASLIYVVVALVVGVGGYMISIEMITIAVIVSTVGCFRMGTSAFSNILPFFNDLSETISACKNIFDFFDIPIHIDVSSEKGVDVDNLQGDIVFSDVKFTYPSRKDTQVLNRYNLTIPNGKSVALVGASGSGKSTILSLISRFFDPGSGKITIGGRDIKDMNVNSLRKRMGVVSQEPVLFDGTIEENIRYGNLEASFMEVQTAAELANAHGFIAKLPQAYGTMVGERGSMLSGGQKQRIVIARALVRNPDVWLLDEATSALDRNSEILVQSTLDRVLKGKTTVVIAHRLSAVRNADTIHVMKDGVIVESGNHDELMSKQGAYFSLAKQQIEEDKNELEGNYERRLSIRSAGDRRFSFNRKSSILSHHSLYAGEESDSEIFMEKSQAVSWSTLMRLSKLWMVYIAAICYAIYGLYTPAYSYIFSMSALEAAALPINQIYPTFFNIALHLVYLAIALFVVYFPGSICASFTMEETVGSLRLNMFKSALNQPFEYFDNPSASPTNMANAIIQKPVQFKSIGGMKAGELLGVISFTIAAFAMSYAMFWQIALIQSIFIVVVVLLNWLQIKVKLVAQKKKNDYLKKSSKLAAICFDNIKAVHYLSLQRHLVDKYNDFWKNETKEQMTTMFLSAGTFSVCMAIPNFLSCVNFWLGFYWVTKGMGSVESLAVNNPLFLMVFTLVGGVTVYFEEVSSSKASVGEAINIMNLRGDRKELEEHKVSPEIKGKIEFKNVFFSYPTETKQVLRGLSLTIDPGLIVALVGSSGCGKSTTISLLEKFYECGTGQILVDGVDIKQIRTDLIRGAMSLVTQEPLLFNTSIRENVLYGVKENSDKITEEEIIRVCKQANIHDFISRLPKGYETKVGARGSQLSGGQKQRIAIARALLRNPKILLLDEATSALDTESEKEVQLALNEASKGRTTIMIAHRLSTVKNANLIVVMDSGRIIEKGSHEELVALRGKYYEMLMK